MHDSPDLKDAFDIRHRVVRLGGYTYVASKHMYVLEAGKQLRSTAYKPAEN